MQSQEIAITVENLAPQKGGSLAPFWFGFHNGQFDSFDVGQKSSQPIEALAEDGSTAPISEQFTQAGFGTVQGSLQGALGGDFAPGQVIQTQVQLNGRDAASRYFSYASMILPSNDQFIANDDAREHLIFDSNGQFLGAEFVVDAREAWDAGTEVNDEIPANTAFFGQQTPNTGVDENGVITSAPGFRPRGSGGILDDPRFANADFTAPGYQFVRIRIANLIQGTDQRDVLFGTLAPDDINAGEGNNVVYGNQGNDRIFAGAGNDHLFGGQGDDLINAGDGNNKVYNNRGSNQITTGNGRDIIAVGSGDDLIDSGAGNDLIYDNGGNNVINAGTGLDRVYLGRGSNQVFLNAGEGAATLHNFDYDDTFRLGAGLSADSSLTLQVRGSDTLIRHESDLLARLNGVQLNSLPIV